MHLQVWDDFRPGGSTCLWNLHNPGMFTQIDIVLTLTFTTFEPAQIQTRAPNLQQNVTYKSLPIKPWNAAAVSVSSLELWLICCLLPRALGKTINICSPNTRGGLLFVLPTSSTLSGRNKPARQPEPGLRCDAPEKNISVNLKTQAPLPKEIGKSL